MSPPKAEIFSERVRAGKRTYFIDVKLTAQGRRYLVISESRPVKGESFKHDRVMIFEDHIKQFERALKKIFSLFEEKSKAYDVDEIRKEFPKAYAKWTPEEDALLSETFRNDTRKTISDLSKSFGRKPGAISSRLNKLGLIGEQT